MNSIETNKIICPNCKKEIDDLTIDYHAVVNRRFSVEDNQLYWCSFDDEIDTGEIKTMYCHYCNNELPKEIINYIADNFLINY